jgi:hypothetical protein
VLQRKPIRVGAVRWWLREGANPEKTRPLLEEALAALRSGGAQDLKAGRRKALHRLSLAAAGGAEYLLKSNRYAWRPWPRLRASKARRELRLAEIARRRGIATPVPLAAGEERRWGRLVACHLLIPVVPGVVDLRRLWFGEALSPQERHALVAAFGAFARQIHDAGLFQDDFGPNNFLVRRGDPPELLMIDFERVRARRTPRDADRLWMLAKVDRDLAGAPAGERMRFLRAYARGDAEEARRWWQRVQAFAPRLARRDARRWSRTATRAGRRFETRDLPGGWRGFARREVSAQVVTGALEGLGPGRTGSEGTTASSGVWSVAFPGGLGAAQRAWAAAHVLFARGGLSPRPLAALARGGEAVLLLERGPAVRLLADVARPGPGEEAALRVLFDRLLALGNLTRSPRADEVALLPGAGGHPRALLLAAGLLRLPGRGDPERGRRAHALAAALAGHA